MNSVKDMTMNMLSEWVFIEDVWDFLIIPRTVRKCIDIFEN